VSESFWKTAAASLPPTVQQRYARLFEAADKFEQLLDLVVTSGGRARRALAQTFRGIAKTLRKTARKLDVVARRLTPTL
jgi:succinate dehydrogenase flavin-adding protein (antitoxin of CptAB toxin-antitoxin module)